MRRSNAALVLLLIAYAFAYVDRVNIGFAKDGMQHSFPLSDSTYGLGASLFYAGYLISQIPAGIFNEKLGPKTGIAASLLSWGITSFLFTIVDSENTYLLLRFLLGVSEAAFFPAVILYLSSTIQTDRRGAAVATLFLGVPIGMSIGSVMAGIILSFGQPFFGIQGWRWIFLSEALPTVALAGIVWRYLPSGVTLSVTEAASGKTRKHDYWSAFKSGLIWKLAGICFLFNFSGISLMFWVPSMFLDSGFKSHMMTAFAFASPYVASCVIVASFTKLKLLPLYSLNIFSICLLISAVMTAISVPLHSASIEFVTIIMIVLLGGQTALSIFWGFPGSILPQSQLAAGTAIINSSASAAGLLGPVTIGFLHKASGNYFNALFIISGSFFVSCFLFYVTFKPLRTGESKKSLANRLHR